MKNKTNINWCDCESSNVAKHGYCSNTNTLAIEYKNGGVYHYPNVDKKVYEQLEKADSVGKFVAQNVRNLKFKKM